MAIDLLVVAFEVKTSFGYRVPPGQSTKKAKRSEPRDVRMGDRTTRALAYIARESAINVPKLIGITTATKDRASR
jgi:hypothetical protein